MKFYAFLADGFETVEALAVIDILRRGRQDVVTVAVKEDRMVETAHKIPIMCDTTINDVDCKDGDIVFLPGGIPGTPNLEACDKVKAIVKEYFAEGKYVTAICAAPSILGHLDILQGKKATCFPGFEKDLYGAEYSHDGVVVDGKVITARGMGKAVDLGLKLLEVMTDKQTADAMGHTIQYYD